MKFKPKCKLCQATEELTELVLVEDESYFDDFRKLTVCQPCKDYVMKESEESY